jgi:hypothetical protein
LFGHEDEEPTDEMIEAAKILEKMIEKGKNKKK